MRVEINFFQTLMHVDILTSCHESQMFFMASRRVNPFQKVFTVLCPDPAEELLSQPQPYKMYFFNSKTWKLKLLLNLWAAAWVSCFQIWKQHSSYCTSPSDFLGDQIHFQWAVIFWKESFFFSWAVDLDNGLKIFSKPCCKQIYWHPGFVIPLIEHRESRFSKILKCPKIFRMINKY